MSPTTSRTVTRRTGSALLAGVVAGLALQVAPASAAAPAVANLETKVLKITGRTFGASATVPAGTALQTVNLTTDDPDAGPQGPLGLNPDPSTLVTGEAVTVKANGVTIAATFPGSRATNLVTNAGTFPVLVFNAGGNAYAIARFGQSLAGVTSTAGSSVLNAGAVSSIVTLDYGFLPQGGVARNGRAFVTTEEVGTVTSAGAQAVTVYDADDVRANGDSVGDEVGVGIHLRDGAEVLATVRFADGSFGTVRAVRYVGYAPYLTVTSYLFDAAGLASSGRSIADVRAVLSTAPLAHGLSWSALGLRA